MNPKISVIIPAYNCAGFIGEALSSVEGQTYRDFEIVVVDDGSTDTTREVLEPYVRNGRVRCFHQENGGPATARNRGIAEARGDCIMLLDADDLIAPDCLESVVDFMEKYPSLGFVFSNYDIFDEKGIINHSGVDTWKVFREIPHRETEAGRWIFTEKLTKYIIEYGGFMNTSGLAFRKDLICKTGPLREGFFYGEDVEFYSRLAYECDSGYIDRILSRIRNRHDSLRFDRSKQRRNVLNLLQHAEFQENYFKDDMEIQAVLHKRVPRLAHDLCWSMQQEGMIRESRELIKRYLARYPTPQLRKLLAKNYLLGMVRRS